MTGFSCVVIGDESLLIQCSEIMLGRGHQIAVVVTKSEENRSWATSRGLRVEAPGRDLGERLAGLTVDWLFSIANLTMLPSTVLSLPRKGAINFHDGPLPDYAGLNAPVWALINGEATHGITWHNMEAGADKGDILAQRLFDIAEDETALTLNTRCYAVAIETFEEMLGALETDSIERRRQDFSNRRYFSKTMRPRAAGRLDFAKSADELVAMVRALDFGPYWNPLCRAKVETRDGVFFVGAASVAQPIGDRPSAPGVVLSAADDALVIATGSTPIALSGFADIDGRAVAPSAVATVGAMLPSLDEARATALTDKASAIAKSEDQMRRRLADLDALRLPQAKAVSDGSSEMKRRALQLPVGMTDDRLLPLIGAWAARLSNLASFDIAWRDAEIAATGEGAETLVSDWTPVRFDAGEDSADLFSVVAERFIYDVAKSQLLGAFARDLPARDPGS